MFWPQRRFTAVWCVNNYCDIDQNSFFSSHSMNEKLWFKKVSFVTSLIQKWLLLKSKLLFLVAISKHGGCDFDDNVIGRIYSVLVGGTQKVILKDWAVTVVVVNIQQGFVLGPRLVWFFWGTFLITRLKSKKGWELIDKMGVITNTEINGTIFFWKLKRPRPKPVACGQNRFCALVSYFFDRRQIV